MPRGGSRRSMPPGAGGGAALMPPASTRSAAVCKVAPPVLVYDPAGKLVKSWGGPGKGYDWPDSNHGITIDHEGNVWLAGDGAKDAQILKFSGAGRSSQLGKHGIHNGSNDTAISGSRRRSLMTCRATNRTSPTATATAASSFRRGRREVQRHWGAYGNRPKRRKDARVQRRRPPRRSSSTRRTLRNRLERRAGLRLRSRQRSDSGVPQGRRVRHGSLHRWPHVPVRVGVGHGVFADAQQTYLYAANGVDEKVNVLLRRSLEVFTSFGDREHATGTFFRRP